MRDRIVSLIQLQDCDNRIKTILNRKMEGPLRIQQFEDELKSADLQFQEDNHGLESFKKERRKFEQEIQDLEVKIEKSNIKLSHIKSNKEYQAALKEVEDLKELKFSTEDKAIQIMELTEALEETCLNNKKKQDELRKRFEEKRDDILKELQDMNKEVEQLQKKRDGFSQSVDQELLDRYHFLRDRRGGQAISAVIQGICQTCNMGIPPQKFIELIKGKSMMTCPHCSRIIYWGEEERYRKSESA